MKGKGKGNNNSKPSKFDQNLLALVDAEPENPDKGKGKGNAKGKGKGGPPLAIKDKTKLEEVGEEHDDDADPEAEAAKEAQLLDTAYTKCRSMQILLMKTKLNVEDHYNSFKKNPCRNKHLTDQITANMQTLDAQGKKMKAIMLHKKAGLSHIQAALVEAAGVVKDSTQWVSKLKLLTTDDVSSLAPSKANSKKKGKTN